MRAHLREWGARGPWLAGGFPKATLATFARSLRVPLVGSDPARRGYSSLAPHAAGVQGAVAEEAEHREGRCAASGEAPDRGVPTAVR